MNALQENTARSFAFIAADARADLGERRIMLEPGRVSIARRYQGMMMRLAVPTQAFNGVALCLKPHKSGQAFYQIVLVHRDDELCVVLEEALDDREIIANWQFWSEFLESPRLVERSPGKFESMDKRLGAVAQGDGNAARRTRLTRKRHGSFQARRRAGVAGRSDTVFANEREIICYE